jgi:quercetin dioxygenase-like cupin family protein
MSITSRSPGEAVVVRAAEAETLATDSISVVLLADDSHTNHALSSVRVTLRGGADGATPHRHDLSSELFYVLDGQVQFLAGDGLLTASAGTLIVVPPGQVHAFAAPPGEGGQLLIVITPGVERFEYFRHLARIALGQQPRASLLEVQNRYDTHFMNSAAWQQARRS